MIKLGIWTGVKSNESVFTNSAPSNKNKGKSTGNKTAPECWNCGGPHLLNECKQAKDKKRIAANKKLFLANRRRNPRSVPHKYRPPEKHEKHRRVIDDKPMVYNGRTKRSEQDPSPPGSSANVAENQGSINSQTAPLTQVSQSSQGSQQVSGLTSSSTSSQGQGQAHAQAALTDADRERLRANVTRQMEAKIEAHLTSLFDQLESQL